MIPDRLLETLADGRFHSGQELARALGVSRSAVWKQLRKLDELGIRVDAVRGRGYRLPDGLELLDRETILAGLSGATRSRVASLEVHRSIDSTSARLMAQSRPAGGARICLAEHQSAGRGRRGRRWASPFAANIYLSVGWRYTETPPDLPALPLAVGVMAASALIALGVREPRLKWPNDVLWDSRKLAGILVELQAEGGGGCDVVAGIGLNVAMSRAAAEGIDQPWVDLAEALGPARPHRSTIAAALAERVVTGLARFAEAGFAPFRRDWHALDALAGRRVRVEQDGHAAEGDAERVAADGALIVRIDGEPRRYVSGDVTLRLKS